jgi:cell wall-associated NlpC family hydrolase
MGDTAGVSGLGVGLAAAGGLLVWSGIRNVSPIDTLKEVLGRPSDSRPIGTPFGSTISGVRGVAASVGTAAGAAATGVAGGGGSGGGQLVQAARRYLGVRYVFGGTSKTGMDCSGLVVLALRDIGVKAPRFTTATFGTWAKAQGATRVSAPFASGDVILRTGHMGIALGGGRLIHAPHTGTVVKEAAIWDVGNWWGWRLPIGATGVAAANAAAQVAKGLGSK